MWEVRFVFCCFKNSSIIVYTSKILFDKTTRYGNSENHDQTTLTLFLDSLGEDKKGPSRKSESKK